MAVLGIKQALRQFPRARAALSGCMYGSVAHDADQPCADGADVHRVTRRAS